jgi:hypothetical protein
MCNELKNQDGQFTVGIIGKAHLVDYNDALSEAVRYIHNELERGEDQNPYAILAMP